MYERVIQQPRRLGEVALLAHATYVGLDVDAWQRCLRAKDADRVIDADAAQAAAIGLRRAPSFLLNGRHVAGVQPDGVWRRLIDTELGRAHSEEAPAPPDASGADEVNPPPDEPVRQHPDDFENVESVTD
jgi:predicted DsbA family dithiol-disulfide isomerase